MKENVSFMDILDERMSQEPPQNTNTQQSMTPAMDDAMAQMSEEETVEEEEPEEVMMPDLYELVYGEVYDPADQMSESKMNQMVEAMEQDPRVKEMALKEPEKFALFMYGRSSRMS